jgi:Flp pilus assembly protein TadG
MDRRMHAVISTLRNLWRDRRGVTAATVAFLVVPLLGMAALSVDVGVLLIAKETLQTNTNAAALDGAAVWTATGSQSLATTAAQTWSTTYPVRNVTLTGTPTVAYSCNTATTGLPNCNSTSPNVLTVTQTGTTPAIFSALFGFTTFTVAASATASQAGGSSPPLNVMFIVDSTKSMGDNDDSGCTVPGVSGTPTRYQCAVYGVQLILKQLWLPNDYVGLMIFPGLTSGWAPCGSSYPASAEYRATGDVYQIWPSTAGAAFVAGNTYNNGTTGPGALIDTSPIVKAVGDATTALAGCVQHQGGMGTYYAEVLEQAQSALQAQGKSGNQNVIIFLSDGAANATDTGGSFATTGSKAKACSTTGVSAAEMDATHYYCTKYGDPYTRSTQSFTYGQEQCFQGGEAAKAAAAAGTWVYAIAYDSPTSSDSSDCPTVNSVSDPYTPCTAMQSIASDPTKFFTTNSSCTMATSPNTYTDLATIFKQVSYSLLKPRLVN